MSDIYVLFHDWCLDGFGAAYAAWKAFGFDGVEYIPVHYDEDPPQNMDPGADVYIVDFSYPLHHLKALAEFHPKVQVIDHHESAEKELADWPDAVFDMSKSGAVLTWEFLHPGVPVPELLLHVQDRDLWKFELPDTEAICEALWVNERTFKFWDGLAAEPRALRQIRAEGEIILHGKRKTIAQMVQQAFETSLFSNPVIACNAPVHPSEVCHELLKRHPPIEVALAFQIDKNGSWRWHFRSRKGGANVAALAEQFGGGGHQPAAGATTPQPIIPLK